MSLVPGVCVALLTLSKDSLDGEPMREKMCAESVIYMATQISTEFNCPAGGTTRGCFTAGILPESYHRGVRSGLFTYKSRTARSDKLLC